MKIEKISENQIRCTVTREDMLQRSLKLSELAYGSDKARNLFKDMMRQAELEFGFVAEDMPIMIEAIPYSECVVLVITKVEDPEELDTKFSSFAPGIRSDDGLDNVLAGLGGAANEVLDLFRKIQETVAEHKENAKQPENTQPQATEPEPSYTCLFSFRSLDHIVRLARLTQRVYDAPNSLYRDDIYGTYLLSLTKGDHTPQDYTSFCNIVTEYGTLHHTPDATHRYLAEHYDPIILDRALQTLASL